MEYTAQLKVATLPSSEDGLFALMDGGRSPEVPQALRAMLAGVLGEELARDKAEAEAGVQSADPLQYLTHTFLVAHKYVWVWVCVRVHVCVFVCVCVCVCPDPS